MPNKVVMPNRCHVWKHLIRSHVVSLDMRGQFILRSEDLVPLATAWNHTKISDTYEGRSRQFVPVVAQVFFKVTKMVELIGTVSTTVLGNHWVIERMMFQDMLRNFRTVCKLLSCFLMLKSGAVGATVFY